MTAWQFTLLGLPARLALPLGLAFGGVAIFAALLWLRDLARRGTQRDQAVPERLLARMAPRAGRARDVWAGGTTLAGLLLLSLAAAQPQCGTKTVTAKRFGMDVVIALDASNSMLARDVKPSRLDRAKLELAGLIDRLKGDRVGIVVFAGDAFVQCPLTTDYAAAKLFLRAIDPATLPQQGTALAAALKVSGNLIEGGDRGAAGRAIVVLTDGEDHEGEAVERAKTLGEAGVRIFAVGVGSPAGEPIPILDARGGVTGYKKDRQGNTVMTRLNEDVLRSLAEATSGRYVHSMSGDLGIGEIHDELDRLDKAEFETRQTVQYEEKYATFALPGLALLIAGAAFGEGRFRRRRAA